MNPDPVPDPEPGLDDKKRTKLLNYRWKNRSNFLSVPGKFNIFSYLTSMKGAFKLQTKPPTPPPALQNMKFLHFILFCGSSFLPVSGSMDPLESGSGSETLIGSLNRDPGGENYPQKTNIKVSLI
jgi:hypothetical protein